MIAREFFEYALSLNADERTLSRCQALRLLGHIALDIAQPRKGLEVYTKSLNARLEILGPNDPSLADVYDSVACSYTEMGDIENAYKALAKAVEIHNLNDPKNMSRTDAIFAITNLRAGKPDEALASLRHCWELQGKTQNDIAESKYPKHSGDIVLLARILYLQGSHEAARDLASKTITMRKTILGNKGPRVADSMYLVATMLKQAGNHALAAKLLREVVEMSEDVAIMSGHLARALWTLAQIETEKGDEDRAKELRERAKAVKDSIEGREGSDEETDQGYQCLVSYLLW